MAPSKNGRDHDQSSKDESEKHTPSNEGAKEAKRSAGKVLYI